MKQSPKADLMLHPVRFRIIQCLLGGRHRTAQQMGEELSDVPQATLYRHIKKLVEGGLLSVIDQHTVRGITENVYTLWEGETNLSADITDMSRDNHMRTFMFFVASLMDDYDRYLKQDDFDLLADGVSIRQVWLYQTDEEFTEVVRALRSILESEMSKSPAPGRRRRAFTNIIIPEPKKEG